MRLIQVLFFYCRLYWLFFFSAFTMSAKEEDYTQQYRLQVHYSVPTGWLNDPNGLVYSNGYYHLFYQYYPDGITHGTMNWGHAKSADLIHWENLPTAIKANEKGEIFSGCCVLDTENVTGLVPPSSAQTMIAIYTLAGYDGVQRQEIAYSNDEGLTWLEYEANPILSDSNFKDFRDPNVIKRNGIYYMALAAGDRIVFYSSTNLKEWKFLNDFGVKPNQGDKSGVWECPAIVSLKDKDGNEHDVLIISENGDSRGSLMQYYIGKFSENGFESYYGETSIFWVDHGPDNYAAVPFHNDPKGRVILIGWLSNWIYAQQIPTSTWRGQMTIPRELKLQTVDSRLYLAQYPIAETENIVDTTRVWNMKSILPLTNEQTIDITSTLPFKTGSSFALSYSIYLNTANSGKIGLRFSNNLGEFISFYYNIEQRTYELDRRYSGKVAFNPRFASEPTCVKRISTRNLILGEIILDTASIEIFMDSGLNTFSALFFPTVPFENVQIYSVIDGEKSASFQTLNIRALNGIWKS